MDKLLSKLLAVNELYFGRSPEILRAKNYLNLLRAKYDATPASAINANNDKNIQKFNRILENFFGFGCFAICVIFDVEPWIASVPIGFNFSNKKDKNFIVNKNTYRFNKDAGYIGLVNISTGLIFNKDFTDDEIMAAIIREIGHSFYACMYGGSALLNNIYGAARIANVVIDAVHMYHQVKDIGASIEAKQRAELAKPYADQLKRYNDALNNPNFTEEQKQIIQSTIDNINAAIEADFKEFSKAGGVVGAIRNGLKTSGALITMSPIILNFADSQNYKQTLKVLEDDTETEETFNTPLSLFWNYLKLGFNKFAPTIFGTADDMITWSMANPDKANGIKEFIKRSTFELFVPFTSFIRTSKNPLTWIMMPISKDKEESASAFCTMYGFGSEYISYSDKIKSHTVVYKAAKKAPIIGIFYDLISTPAKILNNIYDASPTGISLQLSQIQLLKNEIKKTSIDPKMKAMIQQDISACEDALAKVTSISKGVQDPDICKHLANKLIYDLLVNTVGKSDTFAKRANRYDR